MNGGVKMDGMVTVALAGNPNSGKTTIFNALTGARQHVGNYPGVTVDKVEGRSNVNGRRLAIVDLPGIYSLTAHSEEELVARNYLLDSAPQVVVDILDASNLERNLYLAVQLLELGIRPVLVLNMHDVAQRSGMRNIRLLFARFTADVNRCLAVGRGARGNCRMPRTGCIRPTWASDSPALPGVGILVSADAAG